MSLDGFYRVCGTTGKVATRRWEKRRNRCLIEADESNENGAHCYEKNRRVSPVLHTSSSASCENGASYVLGRTRTTASIAGRSCNTRVRTISRNQRLSRFRSTTV